MHSTGRSAAMFMESYGPPQVRALTRASRAFYEQPPAGFAETPILAPRGVLYAAWRGQEAALDTLFDELLGTGIAVQRVDAAETLRRVPVLREQGLLGAIAEHDAMDIDVHALHQGYLRGLKRQGGALWCDAELRRADTSGGTWTVALADGRHLRCRTLVNAAGAWADTVAERCGASAARAAAEAPQRVHLRPARRHRRARLADRGRRGRALVLQARRRPAARLARQRRPGAAARRGARRARHRHRHRRHRGGDDDDDPPPDAHLGRAAHLRARRRPGDRLGRRSARLSSGSRARAATASRARPERPNSPRRCGWARRCPRRYGRRAFRCMQWTQDGARPESGHRTNARGKALVRARPCRCVTEAA